jgi:hypothetical protein
MKKDCIYGKFLYEEGYITKSSSYQKMKFKSPIAKFAKFVMDALKEGNLHDIQRIMNRLMKLKIKSEIYEEKIKK